MGRWKRTSYFLMGPLMIWVVFIMAVPFFLAGAIIELAVLPAVVNAVVKAADLFCLAVVVPLGVFADIAPPFVTRAEANWRNRNSERFFAETIGWEDLSFLRPTLNRVRSTKGKHKDPDRRDAASRVNAGRCKGGNVSRRVRIDGAEIVIDAEEMPTKLAAAFSRHERPLCLCCAGGVPMYVARFEDRHVLKRMPETGPQHDPDCESYEPPSGLTGLGAIEGDAIIENPEDGTTLVKLGFGLSKLSGRVALAVGEGGDSGEARGDGARLSLRATLHYLWDRAEFNRWRPAMAGRRNWAVIRKFLTEAALTTIANGRPLSEFLYVPEMFDSDREEAILQGRAAFLSKAIQVQSNRHSLVIMIGEVKEIATARFGFKLVIKHAPRFPFMLAEDLHRRMSKAFAQELALWNASPDSHLVAAATFGISVSGVAAIEAIALMVVSERWIPFDHRYEANLIEALIKRGGSFAKGLRYDLPSTKPMANIILRKEGSQPVAMYLIPDNADAGYREALNRLIGESGMPSWQWEIASGPMPDLPL